jgi:hypothetical protein
MENITIGFYKVHRRLYRGRSDFRIAISVKTIFMFTGHPFPFTCTWIQLQHWIHYECFHNFSFVQNQIITKEMQNLLVQTSVANTARSLLTVYFHLENRAKYWYSQFWIYFPSSDRIWSTHLRLSEATMGVHTDTQPAHWYWVSMSLPLGLTSSWLQQQYEGPMDSFRSWG